MTKRILDVRVILRQKRRRATFEIITKLMYIYLPFLPERILGGVKAHVQIITWETKLSFSRQTV